MVILYCALCDSLALLRFISFINHLKKHEIGKKVLMQDHGLIIVMKAPF